MRKRRKVTKGVAKARGAAARVAAWAGKAAWAARPNDGREHERRRRNTSRAVHDPMSLRAGIGAHLSCGFYVCGLSASQALGWIAAERLRRAAGARTRIDAVA